MTKPTVLIFSGYGLNCETETATAFELAGATADIVHINDLIAQPKQLKKYQIVAFPGGFSYGDDTGSGNAFANKVRNHLWEPIKAFVASDNLAIGICNGFQILVNLGLVPATDNHYGEREVALLHNDSARYTVRWVDLNVTTATPWLNGLTHLSLPIAHGEGKLFAEPNVMANLKTNHQIALTYTLGEQSQYQNLPANPNGSMDDIAGIIDPSGRVLGLMPHPERAIFFNQLPNWPVIRQLLIRAGETPPESGPGLMLFKNAVRYFA